jgi:hypothetical protein
MNWYNQQKSRQVNFPLDYTSSQIVKLPNSLSLNRSGLQSPVIFTDLLKIGLGVRFLDQRKFLWASVPLILFTVNPATDVFTSARPVKDGDVVALASSGTLPTGVDSITYYTVTNAGSNTFKLSGVNVTDTGSGTHYFGVVN